MKYLLLVISLMFSSALYSQLDRVSKVRVEGTFAVFTYKITDDPSSESGICMNTTGNPTTVDRKVWRTNPGTGTFIDSVSGLTTGTLYYWKAYVIILDTITYSSQKTITTQGYAQPASQPSISNTVIDSAGVVITWPKNSDFDFVAGQIVAGSTPASNELIDVTDPTNFDSYVASSPASFSGLTKNTTYSVSLESYNATSYTSADCNLRQDSPETLTFTTLKGKPTTQASNVVAEWAATTTIDISCTKGDGDRRLIYMNTSNSFTAPTDETTVTANSVWQSSGQQCIYNGTDSSVNVSNTENTTTYYFRVYEFNNESTPYYQSKSNTGNPGTYVGKTVWQGDNSSSWTTAGNWQNDNPPGSSSEIIIPDAGSNNDPVISSNSSVGSITIQDGGNITVNTGVTLSLSGDLTVKGASGSSGIVCKGTGSVSASGISSYERYIDQDGWHLLSSPNSNSSVTQLAGIYVNSWNEATVDWNNLTSSSALNVMQGYSVRYGTAAKTITFTGDFNNGDQSISVTNANPSDGTETYGWNLVGNPYPSPIDWDASSGWTRTGINSTVYVYDVSGGSYSQFNYSSQTGPFYIPPTQGFYVYATTSSSSLQMTNEVRATASTAYYKKEVEYPFINLIVSNGIKEDKVNLIFHPEATGNFETYDGLKLFGWNEDVPQVYTYSEDNKLLSINTINSSQLDNIEEPIIFKLGYTTQIETPLSFTIDEMGGFTDDINVTIHDKDLDIYYNITTNSYEFFSDIGEYNDRFDIIISKAPNSIIDVSENTINCYTHNNTLIIRSQEPIKNSRLLVYDVLGRAIINKSLTTKTRHVFTIPEKTNIFVVNILQDKRFLYRKTLVK